MPPSVAAALEVSAAPLVMYTTLQPLQPECAPACVWSVTWRLRRQCCGCRSFTEQLTSMRLCLCQALDSVRRVLGMRDRGPGSEYDSDDAASDVSDAKAGGTH